MDIIKQIGTKGADANKIARKVLKKPELIKELIEALQAPKGAIRFGIDKVLRLVSEERPELIYPYFAVYGKMLDIDNSFLKWGAIMMIANLAAVDSEDKIEKIFARYYKPIAGPVMVTAANIIGGSVKIAQAKPKLTAKITKEILKVEQAKYINKGELSPECRNVAIGQAIETFDEIFEQIDDKKTVIKFVEKQLKNTRPAVVKKAVAFLKKHAA